MKAGRTHLMDATPVTLGQELGGYAAQVAAAADRLRAALPRVGQLPLGGTAVGTGLNAPAGFGAAVAARLADDMGLPLSEAPDHFAAQGARDELVGLSGDLRVARRRAHQDRQRPPLDGSGSARPGSPRSACPTCSRAARSCRAR